MYSVQSLPFNQRPVTDHVRITVEFYTSQFILISMFRHLLRRNPCLTTPQRRWNWQIFLTKRFDRATGTYKYPDWDRLVLTMKEPTLYDGTSLLRRSQLMKFHIKPTTMRKRAKERKVYNRSVKRVEDLMKYVKFTKERDNSGDRTSKK